MMASEIPHTMIIRAQMSGECDGLIGWLKVEAMSELCHRDALAVCVASCCIQERGWRDLVGTENAAIGLPILLARGLLGGGSSFPFDDVEIARIKSRIKDSEVVQQRVREAILLLQNHLDGHDRDRECDIVISLLP